MFRRRIPLKLTADWCRSLAGSLSAGVSLKSALATLAQRGDDRVRELNRRLLDRLEEGEDFAGAVVAVQDRLHPLFTPLTELARHTGQLPEILRELERYLRFQIRLQQRFRQQIFWPVLQLTAAVFVVALVIYILGLIESTSGSQTIDLLGFGLKGAWGATLWLSFCFATAGGTALLYWAMRNLWHRADAVDRFLLRTPVLGEALRLLASSRLALALHLTLGGGLSAHKAVPLSLRASDNAAFEDLAKPMRRKIRNGESVAAVFDEFELFPPEFQEVLHSAEEAGRTPEAMKHLAEELGERAEHQLALLNTALGWAVWCFVAAFIIFFIFRIMLSYVRVLNEFL